MCNQQTELQLYRVWVIAWQVVCQLIVYAWSVNHFEREQFGDQSFVECSSLIIEDLEDHSSLSVYVRHCGCIVGFDQHCLTEDFLFQME